MSKVGNLRAMFEQRQGETSPPSERGRSPGIPSGSESPRPLSKVRTNFIAVEKDGRIGLQRDVSRDSSVSTQRFGGEADGATSPPLHEPTILPDKMEKTATKTNLRVQPIPESPRADTGGQTTSIPPAKKLFGLTKAEVASPIPDKPTDAEEPQAQAKMSDPSDDKVAVASNGTTEEAPSPPLNGAGKKATPTTKDTKAAAKPVSKPTPKTVTTTTTTTAKSVAKPAKSPTALTASRAPKSPVPPAVAATAGPKHPTKTPENKSLHPEKATTTPKAGSATSKSTDASSIKKPPQLPPSPNTGLVKPKLKSPTRPVKLSPNLTHTTAAVSKASIPRQSLSRASGIIHASSDAGAGRAPSRASAVTAATAGQKTLKRQSSTIGRPRPSLGPPPKQVAKDHPPTRKEKEIDEGFLARMMRPTQASSSKATEKVPLTPPRRPAGAAPVKKPLHRFDPKPVRKVAPSVTSASASASVSASVPASGTEEDSAANEIAAEAEHAATAEEVIRVAKEAEGEVFLAKGAGQKSAAQEVATAHEAVGVAKRVEGEVALVAEVGAENHVGHAPELAEGVDGPKEEGEGHAALLDTGDSTTDGKAEAETEAQEETKAQELADKEGEGEGAGDTETTVEDKPDA